MSASRRITAAERVMTMLERQPVWQQARAVLFFASLADELDLWPLLEKSLTVKEVVALPRFDAPTGRYVAARVRDLQRDLCPGKFGVREPDKSTPRIPLNRLDLVLVPGVAFDVRGWRLGRGKSFYDRLLTDFRGTKCGVAFDEQIVDAIPVEPHDIQLDCILTPTRWIET